MAGLIITERSKPTDGSPVPHLQTETSEANLKMAPPHAARADTVVVMAAHRPDRLWSVAVALLIVSVIAMLWFPLLHITALPSNNYNEGWNAYRQWMTVEGKPLYGSRPGLWITNYPFLSFHIIGLLGAARENMVLAGRVVCFISLIATAALIGGSVRLATGSRIGSLYAALALVAWFASFYDGGRASNDPELLSVAVTSFGLFSYLKRSRSLFWVALSACAFSVSLFIKHDLIAFPVSIAIHLAITRHWRDLAVFVGAGVALAALLLTLSFYIDGAYFFAQLLQRRAYSLDNLGYETLHYLLHFAVPLVMGIFLLLRDRSTPYRSFLFTLLIVTHLAAVYFSGGDGVGANIFYPAVIADLLTCLITISGLGRAALREPQARATFRWALALLTLACVIMVPSRVQYDLISQRRMAAATETAQQAIARLKSVTGPVICEDLLLCYDAGKPMDYDPYYVEDQILVGRLQESDILAMLRGHQYGAVQIDGEVDAMSYLQRKDKRFSIPFLRTLLAEYTPVLATPIYSVFVPRR